MALSDTGGILASPLTIIDGGDEAQSIDDIVGIIGQYRVGRVIHVPWMVAWANRPRK